MWYLLWFVAVAVIGFLWLALGSSDLCPSCGLQVVESDLDRLERQVFGKEHCPHCGAPLASS